jgi:hypothetical protein
MVRLGVPLTAFALVVTPGIGVRTTGTLTLTSVIVLGASVLVGLVVLGLGFGSGMGLARDFSAAFPIPLVNFLNEVSETIECSGFVEMHHFVFDSLPR